MTLALAVGNAVENAVENAAGEIVEEQYAAWLDDPTEEV